MTEGVLLRLKAYSGREPPSVYDGERLYLALHKLKETGGNEFMEKNFDQKMNGLF